MKERKFMIKKAIGLILASVVAIATLTGCAQKNTGSTGTSPANNSEEKTEAKKEVKVGFLYVGPVGDGGWTFSHDLGRKDLEKELGVKTTFKESVKEDKAEVKKVIDGMVDEGYNVIFGTSFGFMDGMEEAAKEYPDVKFFHCSGYKSNTTNFVNYFGRIEQARYLSGIVAGMKTTTNKIGYVAAFEIPEVIRGINSFTLGVRSVKPDAVIKVNWTHTWYDPATEKEAAKALLDQGVDIIAQHQDTAGPQQAAQEKGVFSIGYNTDMKDVAPKAYMTAPIWNWGPYYIKQVKAISEGTWKAENYWNGMEDGIVELADLTDIAPEGAKEAVEKAKADILSGKNKIFVGPLKDQTGAEKVPAGKVMTDEEWLNYDWFVEGVEGTITK
jgi:basic membrane protein A and related proteins